MIKDRDINQAAWLRKGTRIEVTSPAYQNPYQSFGIVQGQGEREHNGRLTSGVFVMLDHEGFSRWYPLSAVRVAPLVPPMTT